MKRIHVATLALVVLGTALSAIPARACFDCTDPNNPCGNIPVRTDCIVTVGPYGLRCTLQGDYCAGLPIYESGGPLRELERLTVFSVVALSDAAASRIFDGRTAVNLGRPSDVAVSAVERLAQETGLPASEFELKTIVVKRGNNDATPTIAIRGIAPLTFEVRSIDDHRSTLAIFDATSRSVTASTMVTDESQIGAVRMAGDGVSYALVVSTSTDVDNDQVKQVWNSLRSIARESNEMIETEITSPGQGLFRSWGNVKQLYR